jgi:hypothetical protein
MSVEDKKLETPNIAEVVKGRKFSIKIASYIVGALILLAALAIPGYLYIHNQRSTRSNGLIKNINDAEHSSRCSSGLKKIAPIGPKLANSSQYTLSAREQGLNYLINCEFINGNTKLALSYADQLNSLYSQDHNAQKQQDLSELVLYIKSYEH